MSVENVKINHKYACYGSGIVLLSILAGITGFLWISFDETARADLLLFFGRFHILAVHLPIALILLSVLMELLSRFQKFSHLASSVTFVLLIAAASSVASVIAGFMLATGGGYNESLLDHHKWWGLAVAVLTVTALIFKMLKGKNQKITNLAYSISLTLSVTTLLVASHYGGSLTHGQNYLTAYMPDSLQSFFGVNTNQDEFMIRNIDEAVIFSDLVFPILNDRCVSCHNPDRTEGDLRLDSFDLLEKGGESGPVIISHSPEESDLFRRIIVPRNHDDRMPPGNRRPLTEHQIEIIRWWISEGAHREIRVVDARLTTEIEPVLARFSGRANEQPGLFELPVEPADDNIINRLREHGILITPVSAQHHYLRASFVNVDAPDPELIQSLHQIATQLIWLDLSHSPVNDEFLAHIPGLYSLTRLNLNSTGITDEGIQYIGMLENLEHLSISETAVTDAALEILAELPNLKNLYLWQTKVSEEGFLWFRNRNPDVYANLGFTLAEPDTIILPPEEDYGY